MNYEYLLFTDRYSLLNIFANLKNSLIYCYKNSYAAEYCKNNQIEAKIFSSKKNFNKIISLNLDKKIILNGCKYLLSKKVLNKLKYVPLNIHPSLLPNYKGQFVVDKIFYNNEKEIGVTLHEVNHKIDSGKIIHQIKVKYKKNEFIIDLYHKLFKLEEKLFKEYFFKNIKTNLNIKKKKIKIFKKKNIYSIKDINKCSLEFIGSKCVPNKFLKLKIGTDIKKIVFCQPLRNKSLHKNIQSYIKLSEIHYILKVKHNQLCRIIAI